MGKPPLMVSPEALRLVKPHRSLPDTPSDRLPRSRPKPPEVSLELAYEVLLDHYVKGQDWFMAERLTHDLKRLHESQAVQTQQKISS